MGKEDGVKEQVNSYRAVFVDGKKVEKEAPSGLDALRELRDEGQDLKAVEKLYRKKGKAWELIPPDVLEYMKARLGVIEGPTMYKATVVITKTKTVEAHSDAEALRALDKALRDEGYDSGCVTELWYTSGDGEMRQIPTEALEYLKDDLWGQQISGEGNC